MGDVAIVGMAGRFPGAEDTDAFWRMMIEGRDAIAPVPAERWDPGEVADPDHDIPSVGGFLEGVDLFDAAFFGVSPREAAVLDPQQRLMLETGWSALEDAGQRASDIRGSRTGVYIGGLWHDHELVRKERDQPATQHSIVGNSLDIVAARLSYHLGLRGPSLTVESSCSSSLMALHLACQALRNGDIDGALVGGVNLMLSPDVTVGLTHFGGLSPTGRCRPFGAGADGFVRGEGVVTVYLKPVERAQREGDAIRGVVTASAVNNDGGGASLVTPNPDSQRDLLREVYGSGGALAERVAYIEAHGTGTARGDASEADALGAVAGTRTGGGRLPIGSVKSNIGHLEPAAGLAGLVKAVLSLERGVVPPSLNADEPNPDIDFAGLGLDVAREPLDLPTGSDVCIGVSSFGWGGTNAHVVLARPPAQPAPAPEEERLAGDSGPYLLPVSGHNEPALRHRVDDVLARISSGDSGPEMARALAWHRDHFPEREAVVVDGEQHTQVRGRAREVGKVAFVFPGQGAQWQAMGAGLYGRDDAFTQRIDECARALSPLVDWDLRTLVTGGLGEEWQSRVDMVQPALWAMSVSLAAAWQQAGVHPDVVIGHSQGEIAAATVAGSLSVADAALIVAGRSALLRESVEQGRMLAVDLDPDSALKAIEGFEESVSLAAHNGPRSCVLSGESDSVLLLKEILESEEVFCRLVGVDYASHSPQMDPLLSKVRSTLAPIRPRSGSVTQLSTVEPRALRAGEVDAGYWADNLRRQVRFAEAVDHAVDTGVSHLIEISPHPGLSVALGQLAERHDHPPAVLTTLRRGEGEPADLTRAFARAYVSGLSPWGRRAPRRPSVTPPPYPWQRQRYAIPERSTREPRAARLELPLVPAPSGGGWLALGELSLRSQPWLEDHKVLDTCTFPAGGYLALLRRSLEPLASGRAVHLREVELPAALGLGTERVRLCGTWLPATDSAGQATISAMAEPATEWTLHCRAQARLVEDHAVAREWPEYLEQHPATESEEFYRQCARRALHYGPAFRAVQRVHAARSEALAAIRPARRSGETGLWDAILQTSLALEPEGVTVVPTAVAEAVLAPADTAELWVHARRVGEHEYDLTVFDASGEPVGRVAGLVLAELGNGGRAWHEENVYRMRLEPTAPPEDIDPAEAGPVRAVCGTGRAEVAEVAAVVPGAHPVVLGDDPIPECGAVVFVVPEGPHAQRAALAHLARLAAECADRLPSVAISVVTRNAQPAPDGSTIDPGAALFTGFTAVLQSEYPQFRARQIDTDTVSPALGRELVTADGEDLVVRRGERRWVGRRVRGGAEGEEPGPWRMGGGDHPHRLGTQRPGRLDSLCGRPIERRAPGPGEVEVEIEAASLNFIDVMKAMGVYPDASADPDLLGLDCAGTITAVGDRVDAVEVGQSVVACAPGALATHTTLDARHVAPVPPGLTPAQACAVPMVMTTAWHALVDTARLQPGETVLIHSATGGLGLAAIAVARLVGATIIATAGSEAKRDHLRHLGIDHVFDSRDLEWAADVRAATGGRGVDVVLNTLTGAALPLGMEVLADDGRFIELGKRDIFADASVDLRAFRKAVTFAAVDMAGMLRRRPQQFATLLDTVMRRVADARLTPLPVTQRPFADAEGALRLMSAGEHIGKVVLTEPRGLRGVVPDPRPRREATYLITGGLGALGLSLAEHLGAAGAGAIALLGRSEPDEDAARRIRALRGRGTRVEVWRSDVTDEAGMATALQGIRAQMPPLRGVFHAAGVLDDATLPNLDGERLERVLGAKVDGAALLDRLTAEDPLDAFVLFSSAAVFVGTAGQAAYAAANSYLDALADVRRRSGMAGLSVQWGPIRDVGLAARRADRGDRLADRGMGGVSAAECWRALDHFLEADESVVAYAALDPHRWVQTYPALAAMASWRTLAEAGPGDAGGERAAARLRELPPSTRRDRIEEVVIADAAAVLGLDPTALGEDRDTPLRSRGLDSLMSLELRNRLEASLGVRLSPTLLWRHGDVTRLSAALSELFDTAPSQPEERSPTTDSPN